MGSEAGAELVNAMAFAVGGAVMCLYWPPKLSVGVCAGGLTLTHALVLGVLLGAAAVIGDLAESLIKREAGVKDSGHLFPGIGGILDLLDSLLFIAPIMYLYLRHVLTHP